MLRSRVLRMAVVALPLLFGASKAMASLWLDDQRVDVLTARSDVVVVGRVESVNASWNGPRIVSEVQVSVEAALKGKPTSEIKLLVPGGTARGIGESVSSQPEFHPGDEAVLFLVQHTEGPGRTRHYHVFDGKLGVVRIDRDALGNEKVRWMLPATGRMGETPLSSLAEFVRAKAKETPQ